MSEESGLRDYASVRGFARFLGCSESAIRNIERKDADRKEPISRRLAQLIEWRTGVSANWLMQWPDDSVPIRGVNGRPWRGENLDLLRLLPGLKPMLIACPSLLPAAIAKFTEMMLKEEFVDGDVGGLLAVLQLLQRRGLFDRIVSGQMVSNSEQWPENEPGPLVSDALGLLAPGAEELSKEQLRELEFRKSVELKPSEGSRIDELWDNYLKWRKKSLKNTEIQRNRHPDRALEE